MYLSIFTIGALSNMSIFKNYEDKERRGCGGWVWANWNTDVIQQLTLKNLGNEFLAGEFSENLIEIKVFDRLEWHPGAQLESSGNLLELQDQLEYHPREVKYKLIEWKTGRMKIDDFTSNLWQVQSGRMKTDRFNLVSSKLVKWYYVAMEGDYT